MNRVKEREIAIDKASAQLPDAEKPANRLAHMLHPKNQSMTVAEIITHNQNCKSYILKSEEPSCAYFSSGQYLSVEVEIEGNKMNRPYSISSSPKDSLAGVYRITVKAVPNGLVSNHIINNWTVGTKVNVSDPIGTFTYEPLRDEKQVIAIAGGSGITPFVSLAHAVADGDEDCELVILYSCHTKDDVLFKEELDRLQSSCDKIKVVYVISSEEGHINADIIKKYATKEPFSVFVCGPQRMYTGINEELKKFNLKRKHIRFEAHEENIVSTNSKTSMCMITVLCRGSKISFEGMCDKTILRNLEENHITPPTRCRNGECGFCRSRLISGEVYVSENIDKRRKADIDHGYIHPCCTYPVGDIVIEVTNSSSSIPF